MGAHSDRAIHNSGGVLETNQNFLDLAADLEFMNARFNSFNTGQHDQLKPSNSAIDPYSTKEEVDDANL